jgi:hypothetical protein
LFFLAEYDRKGGKKILEGCEALLTIDDVQGLDADETLAVLWLKYCRAQKMGSRLIVVCPDIRFFRNVSPKSLPLVFLVPHIRTLEERHAILAAALN